jgi:hypothetical protein
MNPIDIPKKFMGMKISRHKHERNISDLHRKILSLKSIIYYTLNIALKFYN